MRDVLLSACLLLIALPAAGTISVYTDRTAWEVAVGTTVVVEDFENVPLQEIPSIGGQISMDRFNLVVGDNLGGLGVFDGMSGRFLTVGGAPAGTDIFDNEFNWISGDLFLQAPFTPVK